MNKKEIKRAVFAGSFDPFTIGHLDIVKSASKIFDEVHVVIAVNPKKTRTFEAEEMAEGILLTLMDECLMNCGVVIWPGLLAEYCADNDIKYIVRGLRNSMDYNYEENIAEVNKLINPDLEVVYLRAGHVAISSSMVKELIQFDQDVSRYLPVPILCRVQPENRPIESFLDFEYPEDYVEEIDTEGTDDEVEEPQAKVFRRPNEEDLKEDL